VFEIRPADEEHRFQETTKIIGMSQVVLILDALKVTSTFPIILLDESSLDRFRDNSGAAWLVLHEFTFQF